MDQIILAFERENSSRRLKEILESAGITGTLICASADQVCRAVRKFRVSAVVCGHKLGDQSAEMLFEDLPLSCSMLVLASQERLELMQNEDIFRLPTPVSRRDLINTVWMLLRMGHRLERIVRPQRPPEEQAVLTVKLGPWIPNSMATCAAAILPMIMGTNRGPIFFTAPVE